MSKSCTIKFDGSYGGTYFVPCDAVKYFTSDLVNTSNSTVRLVKEINRGQDNVQTIIFSPNSYGYVYSYSRYQYITDASNVRFNSTSHFYREYDYMMVVVFALVALASLKRVFTN